MIYAYGVTARGADHIRQGTVCQDAHKVIKCGGDLVIAAVADGLGSEKHSDVAAKIAAETACGHCAAHITNATADILKVIRASFSLAQDAVEKEARANGHAIDQYDTTLTLAVVLGDTLYYGHSGDSGIIALATDGLYEKVTEQQRDKNNCVFPLFFKDKWVFQQYEKKVCGVLLATDGLFEVFFPVYIRNEPVSIHVALARFFMDNRNLCIDKVGEDEVKARMEEFIQNIPGEQIGDDKTVVVIVNPSLKPKSQPKHYYQEPDWAALKQKWDQEWKRQAYPHLFEQGE